MDTFGQTVVIWLGTEVGVVVAVEAAFSSGQATSQVRVERTTADKCDVIKIVLNWLQKHTFFNKTKRSFLFPVKNYASFLFVLSPVESPLLCISLTIYF